MKIITPTQIIEISKEDEAKVRKILQDRPWSKSLMDIFIQSTAERRPVTTSQAPQGKAYHGGNICMVTLERLNKLCKLIEGYEVKPALLDKLVVDGKYDSKTLLLIAAEIAAAPVGLRQASLFPYSNIRKEGEMKYVHHRIYKPKGIALKDLLAAYAPDHMIGQAKVIKFYPFQQGNSPADADPNIAPKPDMAIFDNNQDGVVDIKYQVLEIKITVATTIDNLTEYKQKAASFAAVNRTSQVPSFPNDVDYNNNSSSMAAISSSSKTLPTVLSSASNDDDNDSLSMDALDDKKPTAKIVSMDALEPAEKKPVVSATSVTPLSAPAAILFKAPAVVTDSNVYNIAIHNDYSAYLKDYLQSLNGKATNDSRLCDDMREILEENESLCSSISTSIPNIPVMLGENLYSLEELEALFKDGVDTAIDPLSRQEFKRSDIASARKAQDKINTMIQKCSKRFTK